MNINEFIQNDILGFKLDSIPEKVIKVLKKFLQAK
jgi:hypothetical protein